MPGGDIREAILAQLAIVCEGVDGIQTVGRNVADVTGKARPAVLIHDASESIETEPPYQPRPGVQVMNLNPQICLLIAAPTSEWGRLLDKYRRLLIVAICQDPTLIALCFHGEIRYEGSTLEPPESSDQREGRMEFEFELRYVFRVSDLAS